MNWFEVDKQGLAKLLARRGKSFALLELISNAWDTDAKNVNVTLQAVSGKPEAHILVQDDDPNGFRNLTHAWTLFAESERKAEAAKRGRFNLGEKLVLAVCSAAEITTTTGSVRFDKDGRHTGRKRLGMGSLFEGYLRMTRDELKEALQAVHRLIVPEGVTLRVNGKEILHREPLAHTDAVLPTEIADAEGNMRRSERKALVTIYKAEAGWLYELGVPVVETGDTFDVDVMQKIPLNMDRDNVLPSFLKAVRVTVLNATAELLQKDDATKSWVREAAGDSRAAPLTVERALDLRFGEKRVAYDPSDLEANNIAVAHGYTVVPGGALSKGEWENARSAGAVKPAGQVTPSPKPFTPGGKPLTLLDPKQWTDAVGKRVNFAKDVAKGVLGFEISVQIASEVTWPFSATYGGRVLTLNLGRLGNAWFRLSNRDEKVLALLVHELAHEFAANHLSTDFHDACCRVGAGLAVWAFHNPELFKQEDT